MKFISKSIAAAVAVGTLYAGLRMSYTLGYEQQRLRNLKQGTYIPKRDE
jgi:hypothetical protein